MLLAGVVVNEGVQVTHCGVGVVFECWGQCKCCDAWVRHVAGDEECFCVLNCLRLLSDCFCFFAERGQGFDFVDSVVVVKRVAFVLFCVEVGVD